MATPEDLARWVAAVECYSAADIQGALDLFSPMSGYSKIAFNLGMLHLEQKDYKRALESLDKAVVSDKYMAVAHFQKAYIHFLLDELGTAEKEYTLSLNLLLDNEEIDYRQIGLTYKLYKAEILYNRAMIYERLGREEKAAADIQRAKKGSNQSQEQQRVIGEASRRGYDKLTLFSVPTGLLFLIPESKAKNLSRRAHLKDAKVVEIGKLHLQGNFQGNFYGFGGAVLVQPGLSRAPEPATILRSNNQGRMETNKRPTLGSPEIALSDILDEDFGRDTTTTTALARDKEGPTTVVQNEAAFIDPSKPALTAFPSSSATSSRLPITPNVRPRSSSAPMQQYDIAQKRRIPSGEQQVRESLIRKGTMSPGPISVTLDTIRIKVHLSTKDTVIAMVISKSIPLTDLLQKIGSKFKLYGSLKLVYKEKTLTTDDHLARVLHNTNLITTALHFSVTTEEDIFDFY